MNEPFVFRKVLYLVEATGKRARTLDELLRVVTVVDPMSISYHMHREYLAVRFMEPEWPNDFAAWAADVVGDRILAEKLAALRVFNYRALASLQLDLGRMIAHHLEEFPVAGAQQAPPGRDFIFCMARAVVCDCNRQAKTLGEFQTALSEVESSSIFFHLFETRFAGGDRANDFALWARESLRNPRLADRLESFDPYMFSLEGARKALLRMAREAE
jgi:Family of unknown function (DUF5752)